MGIWQYNCEELSLEACRVNCNNVHIVYRNSRIDNTIKCPYEGGRISHNNIPLKWSMVKYVTPSGPTRACLWVSNFAQPLLIRKHSVYSILHPGIHYWIGQLLIIIIIFLFLFVRKKICLCLRLRVLHGHRRTRFCCNITWEITSCSSAILESAREGILK